MKQEYLEVSVVANRLNISAATVYRMIQTGKLSAVNHGAKKAIRIPRAALEDFENQRRNAEW